MGESFVCPACDRVESNAGECPECGAKLAKLDMTAEGPQDLLADEELGFAPAEPGMSDFADEEEEPSFHEGGIRAII